MPMKNVPGALNTRPARPAAFIDPQDQQSRVAAASDAASTDPAYGADPTLGPAATAAPQVAPRMPGMTSIPTGSDAINDDDLLTPEELAQRLAQITGQDPEQLGAAAPQHDANLADLVDPASLDKLGSELMEMVEADIESRQPWTARFRRGLEILGLKDFVWENGVAPFEGASTAVHPMLAEAVVQSQARLMEEVFPSAGPVKTMVMGQETPEKRDSADRVESHMNYQLTKEDTTYYMESQKLALYLPIFGTAYRKAYHDFVQDKNVLRYIPGEDLILPYTARNLTESPRKTHRFYMDRDEYSRAAAAGAYRVIDLPAPPEPTQDATKSEVDKLDSKTPATDDKDNQWTFYEIDLRLDLKGFEDKDAAGKPTGVALPYTVTVESENNKIVAIRRCWKENDPLKLMRVRYAEYWYLPGLGSMGFGLIHWVGTLAEAGTDALRALLDSATWANLQGGFKAKDAGTKAGELHMKPGVWADVDMTADELAKAFHTPPVKEPSDALFKLLGFLTEQAQRFASTSDAMVGEQDAKGAPVGTTIALIEQGSKVYSGVHKRAHFAAGIEFQMLFDLNAEYIPEEGYPYQVPGDDLAVYRADYDTTQVCVVPVSDPNIFSQTQRIALAQTRYQIAKDNPAYFKMGEVLKSLFKAFKDPEIDDNMVDPDNVPMMDPVSENVAMTTGRPVKAKDGENHDAHLVTHMSYFQHPQFGGLPQAQKLIGPAMIAHIAEHVALKYVDTQRKLGVPVPPVNLSAQAGTSISGTEQPQQTDAIGQLAAMQVASFMQQSGLTTTPPGQDGEAQDQEQQRRLNESKIWFNITSALAQMAKVGVSLEEGMQAEAAVEGAAPGAAPPAGPTGALGGPPGPVAPPVPAPPPGPASAGPGPALGAPAPSGAPPPAPVHQVNITVPAPAAPEPTKP